MEDKVCHVIGFVIALAIWAAVIFVGFHAADKYIIQPVMDFSAAMEEHCG